MYKPIWELIKKKKIAKVNCPNENRARIRKAVIKEKYNDWEFNQSSNNIYRLTIVCGNGFVLFRLSHALRNTPVSEL